MGCRLKSGLSEPDKMRNKQHRNYGTLEMIKRIRTSVSIKENNTLNKKKRSKSRHNLERIRTKIITSNIYEIRKTTIYKRLSRRSTLQEMNTIK